MHKILIACLLLVLPLSAQAGSPTIYYVDTVNGSDSDDGLSMANAWLTLKHAIETGITRDTTNGDEIRIYAPVGTPDAYASGDPAIAMSSYATDATADAPLIVRGVGNDGSTPAIAYITCAGRYFVNDSVFDYSRWINVSVVGGSATGLFRMDMRTVIVGCLFDNTAGGEVITITGTGSQLWHSDVQGASGSAYLVNFTGNTGVAIGNYVHERTNSSRGMIGCTTAIGNIVHLNSTNSAGRGLSSAGTSVLFIGNTLLNDAAGPDAGITVTGAGGAIVNNYIEGWSGGGVGISASASNSVIVAGNRSFNNSTDFSLNDTDYAVDNSTTAASGVTDRANADYTPTSELTAIGLPTEIGGTTSYINVGAIQTNAAEGGATNIVDPLSPSLPGL